jgi:hypothetical protein
MRPRRTRTRLIQQSARAFTLVHRGCSDKNLAGNLFFRSWKATASVSVAVRPDDLDGRPPLLPSGRLQRDAHAAARELDCSLPVVSKRLQALERRLDARLMRRGTRRLVLTSEGKLRGSIVAQSTLGLGRLSPPEK